MQICIGEETCRTLAQAARLEWLETNGMGGFAASTVTGMNTRRYHGLLTAALSPPAGRVVMLSRLEETVHVDGEAFELGSNRYSGAIHPQGYRWLEAFRLDPIPTFCFRVAGVEIEKQVCMVHGENTTVISYGPVLRPVRLEVRPLVSFRDYHVLGHHNNMLNPRVEETEGCVKVQPYSGLPPMFMGHNAERFEAEDLWYYNFEYEREQDRGLDAYEDLHCPGKLVFELEAGQCAYLVAGLEPRAAESAGVLREAEVARRQQVAGNGSDVFEKRLRVAGDAFIVKRKDGLSTLIAGYPWFTDWGRDTMIALPGLALVTGRFEEARSILEAFASACDQGMIPNRFPDHGETPDYNTVDATLWFFHAVDRYLKYTGDRAFVEQKLWPVLKDAIDWHVRGTRYGIRVDEDGLLEAGEPGVQLTWMDAKVGDWVVTPRQGKAVEINALWYNALCVMGDLAEFFEDGGYAVEYRGMARKAKRHFRDVFWNEAEGCLYDYVNGDRRDPAIRPNQVLVLSLPNRMLDRARELRVLEVVERELLTPLGLRSLAPGDPAYAGTYGGDQWARDGAYHQGTVWGWLIGPFVQAWVRLHGNGTAAREEGMRFLEPFKKHFYEAGLGQISEIFEGDEPHEARGCFAQAWSVSEVLRVYVEVILGRRP
ncbi:MAG: glycogen debranching enzyme N-terminal domain-containing protein, partial [bacterium]|nr:glycogen debranching enzyme N-terminal domain-containing protein [bacterium]